jgi:AcrR family transcriptional regulator
LPTDAPPPTASPALRDVIRDFRQDQIIDVARRLFGERGTVEVSMDEIANQAGVARSTVYVYFDSREQLLRACLQRMHVHLTGAMADAWARATSPTDRLRILLLGLFEEVDRSPAFLRLALAMQTMAPEGDVVVGSELAMIGLDVAGLIGEIVDDGVARRLFRPLDRNRAVTLIGQQIYGALSVRTADPIPLPRETAAVELCDFLLRGLAADRSIDEPATEL